MMRRRLLAGGLGLALLGCTQTPAGPTYDINGNTGPVIVNTTNGSSSPVSTAPCGASSSQKNATTGAPNVPAQDCSTQANGNGSAPSGPAVVLP
jgi:hypothetical protein